MRDFILLSPPTPLFIVLIHRYQKMNIKSLRLLWNLFLFFYEDCQIFFLFSFSFERSHPKVFQFKYLIICSYRDGCNTKVDGGHSWSFLLDDFLDRGCDSILIFAMKAKKKRRENQGVKKFWTFSLNTFERNNQAHSQFYLPNSVQLCILK